MRYHSFLAGGLALALTATALAQTPPRPAQPQPQPQTQPQAQPQTQPQAQPQQTIAYPTALYRMNDVARSLNLNEKQLGQLKQLTEQNQKKYRENYGNLNTLRPEEQYARRQELNRRYAADWMTGAANVLTENQLGRYRQLEYQYGGFLSLTNPDVQKRLNMTPEQQRTLRDSIVWSEQQMNDVNRLGARDRDRGLQSYRDYQRQYQERFNRLLTPEQRRTWSEMTGETYNFQPTFPTLNP